jgi:NAD(P)-dependent dehydrogenase (short-subunit alcohol dehydrogenase family)
MSSLTGRVAIVTGGASGIGEATAEVLAERGASVVIADLNGPGGQAVAARIRDRGHAAIAVTTDLGLEDQIENMVRAACAEFGGIDILHNNAALISPTVMARDTQITEIDADLFSDVLRVNVIGSLLAVKYCVPHMIARGGGVVLNMSSVGGVQGGLAQPMYGISKAAVIGFTRNIAAEYGKQGIRAVGIAPGTIMTPGLEATVSAQTRATYLRHSLTTRIGTPADIAYLVAFLASDEAGFITGITIPVDGGLTTHSPTLADQSDARAAAGHAG